MTDEEEDVSIPTFVIYVLVVIVALIIICTCFCVIYIRKRLQKQQQPLANNTITCWPLEGEYGSPLTVSLESTTGREILVAVQDVTTDLKGSQMSHHHQQGGGGLVMPNDPQVPPPGTTPQNSIFMKYTEPLKFTANGVYVITAYTEGDGTVQDTATITTIHRFRFTVEGTPTPPTVVPGCGDITTTTKIHIHPPVSAPHATIWYSTNGEYPSMVYNGPFTVNMADVNIVSSTTTSVQSRGGGGAGAGGVSSSVMSRGGASATSVLPPGASGMKGTVLIQAVAISGGRFSSEIASTQLQVCGSKPQLFDARLGAPTAMVDSMNAHLYFAHEDQRNVVIYYAVQYYANSGGESAQRRRSALGTADMKPQVFKSGSAPVPVSRDVMTITAWAADARNASNVSKKLVYDASLGNIVPFSSFSSSSLSSSDDSLAGGDGPGGKEEAAVRAPDIYVSCSDVALAFDEVPPGAMILYTLDGSEPEFGGGATGSTRLYRGVQPLRLTRCEHTNIDLVAKVFVEDQDVVRYGGTFSRQFGLQD